MRSTMIGNTLIDICDLWSTLKNKDGLDLITNITLDSRIDRKIFAMNLLQECGSMVPKWNNTTQFEWGHRLWFETHQKEISDMIDTTEYEYNPIENYVLHEETEDVTVRDNQVKDTFGEGYLTTYKDNKDESDIHDMSHSKNGNDTTMTEYGRTLDSEHKVSAFNESQYQPQYQDTEKSGGSDKEITTYNSNLNDNGTIKHTADNTLTETNKRNGDNLKEIDDQEQRKIIHDAHGNTAMYTTQDLIKQQREIIMFNVITWLVNWYKNDNMLLIY